MTTLWNEEVAIALALPILLVVTQAVHTINRRYRTYITAQCIARIAAMMVADSEPEDREMRGLRHRFSSATILNASIFISQHIYGRATHRLALIIEVCEVDYADNIIDKADTFDTAVAMIATHPERAILHIAKIKAKLSRYQVALLSQMIHQAGAPVAYTPLLLSESRNLQLVGIHLCESFTIIDAEPHLQRLTASMDREISLAALFAICSLRGNLATSQVKSAVAQLAPHLRSAFIRRTLCACYSLRSCRHLLSKEEALRFSQRTASYKSQILCN